jgi:hypothetical protein
MRIAETRNEVRVRVGRSRDAFWLCLLKGGNPEPSLFTLSPLTRSFPIHNSPFTIHRTSDFAAYRCRFYCPREAIEPRGVIFFRFWLPFLLPFLVAASGCRLGKHILSMVYSPKIEGLRVEGFRD